MQENTDALKPSLSAAIIKSHVKIGVENHAGGLRTAAVHAAMRETFPGLKKITLRVLWTATATGQSGEYRQTAYLHRDSNYGQGE